MSTSLLYHAFGARHYRYLKTEYGNSRIIFHLKKKREKQRCSSCGSRDVTRRGGNCYPIQTIPIGCIPVYLHLHLNQLDCKACGASRQEDREIAQPRKTYTNKLARFVRDLARVMTFQDIGNFLQMGWHQIRDIVQNYLEKKEARRSWKSVRFLAIDEIAIRKGHNYVTVIVDLESGNVLDTVPGRDADCLKPIFSRLKRAGAKLKAIAVDMSPAYRKAIMEHAPKVTIVHDRFHVVQAANTALDQVRRDEQRRQENENRQIIKGKRFLLLKNWEKLEEKDDDVQKLEKMFALNENLFRAYLLKEDLRQFWNQTDKKSARTFLQSWLDEARGLDLLPFHKLAKTIEKHQDAILAWYDYPISTGPLEGLNNKIKVLKRRGYGYRNQKFFRLLVLFIHSTKFNLAGT